MNDANITKDRNTRRKPIPVYETLTKREKRSLAAAILGRNNLKATYMACEVSENTIKRAIAGFPLKPENAEKIRQYISK